jgi:hypothetical protein
MLSPAQLTMLKDCADGEPTDYADYCYADKHGNNENVLAWRNRDRVIAALIRKGLLDDDLKPTKAGRAILSP